MCVCYEDAVYASCVFVYEDAVCASCVFVYEDAVCASCVFVYEDAVCASCVFDTRTLFLCHVCLIRGRCFCVMCV